MGLQCEIETARESLNTWRQDAPMTASAEPQIDLDRVVWDPEYRDQVLETMKSGG
jgi:hypothetical protein